MHDLDKHGLIQTVPVRAEHAGKNLPASHSKVFYELAFEVLSPEWFRDEVKEEISAMYKNYGL